jgi:hypothetical protein
MSRRASRRIAEGLADIEAGRVGEFDPKVTPPARRGAAK